MRLAFALATAALLSSSLAARADTLFNIQGLASDHSSFYGTLSINPTGGTDGSGIIDSLSISDNQDSLFAYSDGGGGAGGVNGGIAGAFGIGQGSFSIEFPYATSLSAYDGSTICSIDTPCDTAVSELVPDGDSCQIGGLCLPATDVESGIITPVVSTAVTPEPSSVALLGTGLLGLASVLRKRLA